MSRIFLQPILDNGRRSRLPFKLALAGNPTSLGEARASASQEAMLEGINDSLDRCSGVLERVGRNDNYSGDRNSRAGEVLLLNRRFGRSTYDAYLKFDPNQQDGAPIEEAELERNGKRVLSYRASEESSVLAFLVDRGESYLLSGTIGGEGTIRRV